MKSNTYNIKRDLYELTTMSQSLEQYIRDPKVYHNPQGMYSKMPPMTLGTFLLRLRRISALQKQLDVGERAQLEIAIKNQNQVVEAWAVHYHQKLQEEVEMRVNAIQRYLNELSDTPDNHANDYHPELYSRTIIAELITHNQSNDMSPISQELMAELEHVDEKWHTITKDSYFHWDERLREVYPEDHYWWLYRELDVEHIVT